MVSTPLVLSFDLDDTLWPVAPVIAAAENSLWSWLRQNYPSTVHNHDLESLRAARAEVAERFPEQAHDLTFLRHRALKDLFAAAGLPEVLAEEALEIFLAARNRVVFYEDARPALERLRARYRLYALSNGNADLTRCGIGSWFEGHVTARSAGAAKPDARIFSALADAAGVEASRILHIGDDPLADVVGATRAGMQAIWLNRDAKIWPAPFQRPLRTVSTLAEIV